MARSLVELLTAKRNGETLTSNDLHRVIQGYLDGAFADYQMSALLMAIFFRGLDETEMVALTNAMLHSGKVLDLSSIPGVKIDKHSTGGVGDKISICLGPMVAACGVRVPSLSGRGLGHTGGTLDKLEAIPGFRTDLSVEQFLRVVGDVGTCMMGPTLDIAPADKRMYALRDVTGTVESLPLIVASILSKKLAEGADGLVLDVKVGRGAFMKDLPQAQALAEALVRVGTGAAKRVVALLTNMDTPLGHAVGNALETREALEVLQGGGPDDVVECTYALGVEMLLLSGTVSGSAEATVMLRNAVSTGRAAEVMERMIAAQGGDPRVVRDPQRLLLGVGPEVVRVAAYRTGVVTDVDPLAIGLASVALGAGRARADQAIDPAVGICVDAKPGTQVKAGDTLARLFVRKGSDADSVRERVLSAFALGDEAPVPRPLVLGRVPVSSRAADRDP
jgi:pyrimidine-nucleoside phosphorylase